MLRMSAPGAHGVVVGDFVELTSGWDLANGRVFRVSAVATNDITFESINTSSTTFTFTKSAFTLRHTRLTVSLPTVPPNKAASARRRRVLVPARYVLAISASAARRRVAADTSS